RLSPPVFLWLATSLARHWSQTPVRLGLRNSNLLTRLCFGTRSRTHRGGATKRRSRSALLVRGRATGTFPTDRPVRANKRNKCDKRRRPRVRTRSFPAFR